MKLYELSPIDGQKRPFGGYDVCYGMIVRAKDAKAARKLASGAAVDEGKEAWLDPKLTTCKQLQATGEAEIIMRDVNWG